MDGDVELGILLTNSQYRLKGLATSLIYLFRLKYPGNRVYAGTYEENYGMRRTLKKTGFVPNKFYDEKLKVTSHRIRERFDPAYPEDERHLTNSVYYIVDSIHSETLKGVEMYNEK